MASQIKVNEIIKQSGSSITIGESGTTVNIPSGATITNSGTDGGGFGGTNTPYFHMRTSTSNQTITEDVWTKVALSVSVLDSGSGVDTTNYKYTIPSGQGGKWFISGQVSYYYDNNDLGATYFKLSGTSEILQCLPYVASADNDTRHVTASFSGIFDFSATNYIELYVYMQAHGGSNCQLYTALTNSNNMFGYKLIT